jgi:hypothetical protein
MATSVVTVSVNSYPDGLDHSTRMVRLYGTIAVGSGTYATNGLAVTFSGLVPGVSGDVVSAWFGSLKGVDYQYDKTHGTVRIFEAGSSAGPFVELSNGASIGTEVTGDTISFEAVVNKV